MRYRVTLAWIFLSLGFGWQSQPRAGEVFQYPFTAEFVLKSRGTVIGHSLWTLTADDGVLVYQLESKAAGIAVLLSNDHIVERSEWRRRDGDLLPHGYRYDRTGGRKEKQLSVEFQWGEGVAINTSKGKTWKMPIPSGAIDKLSYVFVMMHDLALGKRELEYAIADGGKLKIYTLNIVGEEELQTEVGTVDTVKVLRTRTDSNRLTTFWCAPGYRFLPVKIEHRERDGEVITGFVRSITGLTGEHTQQVKRDRELRTAHVD